VKKVIVRTNFEASVHLSNQNEKCRHKGSKSGRERHEPNALATGETSLLATVSALQYYFFHMDHCITTYPLSMMIPVVLASLDENVELVEPLSRVD
jgi:hypothetical protein